MKHIFAKPLCHAVVAVRRASNIQKHILHRYSLAVFLVELHSIVIVLVELEGKCSQHRLKKRVDGAHVEVGVVEKQLGECTLGSFAYIILGGVEPITERFEIIAFLIAHAGENGKFLHNALLHFLGGFVGESHCEDVAVIFALAFRAIEAQ